MFKGLFSRNNDHINVKSPMNGEVIKLEDVPDEIFSKKLIGDGFAIKPYGNKVYSPVEGTIEAILPTLHSIGIKSKEGLDILIHVGIDTINLKGEGFKTNKKVGDHIDEGELLIEFDKDYLKDESICLVTPVVITNYDKIDSIKVDYKDVKANEGICTIKLKQG